MPMTVDQYRKAFQCKKGESEAACKERCELRVTQLTKEGKLVSTSATEPISSDPK